MNTTKKFLITSLLVLPLFFFSASFAFAASPPGASAVVLSPQSRLVSLSDQPDSMLYGTAPIIPPANSQTTGLAFPFSQLGEMMIAVSVVSIAALALFLTYMIITGFKKNHRNAIRLHSHSLFNRQRKSA